MAFRARTELLGRRRTASYEGVLSGTAGQRPEPDPREAPPTLSATIHLIKRVESPAMRLFTHQHGRAACVQTRLPHASSSGWSTPPWLDGQKTDLKWAQRPPATHLLRGCFTSQKPALNLPTAAASNSAPVSMMLTRRQYKTPPVI